MANQYISNILKQGITLFKSLLGFGLSFFGIKPKYPAYKGVTYAKDTKGEYVIIDVITFWKAYGEKCLHIGAIPDNMPLMSIMEAGRGAWNPVGAMFEPKTGMVWTSNPDPFNLIADPTTMDLYAELFEVSDPLLKLQQSFPTKNVMADALLPLTPGTVAPEEYELAWKRLLAEGRDAQLNIAVKLIKKYTGFSVY